MHNVQVILDSNFNPTSAVIDVDPAKHILSPINSILIVTKVYNSEIIDSNIIVTIDLIHSHALMAEFCWELELEIRWIISICN